MEPMNWLLRNLPWSHTLMCNLVFSRSEPVLISHCMCSFHAGFDVFFLTLVFFFVFLLPLASDPDTR